LEGGHRQVQVTVDARSRGGQRPDVDGRPEPGDIGHAVIMHIRSRRSTFVLPKGKMCLMCRSIKTLRPPMAETVTDEDIHAAALQYVRKVSGFRKPAAHNEAVFDQAVDAITRATAELLDHLEVRGART
jgi:hypothetical protein